MKLLYWLQGLCAAVLISACASPQSTQTELPDGVQLIEDASRQETSAATIPYKKFRLNNGLTVILHEDHSDPIAHVDVTYRVGSNREEVGKSGFAHFFEHMMFQGSEHVADEEHFKIISDAGGALNGSTSADRTNYYQTVPVNHLEKVLWLESDRMGFLLKAVTQEKFEIQRETVKNERGQNYDNRPYGLMSERMGEAMYPEGHPYSWSTIGYLEDLDRVNVNDLKAFFLRWYGPNNAILSIGGNIDEAQTLDWVAKYFGSIPAGPSVDDPEIIPIKLEANRYISMEDSVRVPMLAINWPSAPHVGHKDEAPLDVLIDILAGGKTSLLYKNLTKTGAVTRIQGGSSCGLLHCIFGVTALANPTSDTNLADIERLIRQSFDEFEVQGVLEDDLVKFKTRKRASQYFGMQALSGKIGKLANFEIYTKDPGYLTVDLARYEAVTANDVMRVYRDYVKDKPAVIMSIVPQGQLDTIAAPDTWKRYKRTLPDYIAMSEADLDIPVIEDSFDRSIRPASAPAPELKFPIIWRQNLDNDIRVAGSLVPEVPMTSLHIRIKVGQHHDPIEKIGLASLTANMLNERTTKSTAEELESRLNSLGSRFSIRGGEDDVVITVQSLTENIDKTLSIVAEKLFYPAFDNADFERVKNNAIQNFALYEKSAGSMANAVLLKQMYGADSPLAYKSSGTRTTLSKISREDVENFYKNHYSASQVTMSVTSDLAQSVVIEKLKTFENWEAKSVPAPYSFVEQKLKGGTLFFVDKPDAPQSQIQIAKWAPVFDATGEYFHLSMMNHALGGSFNSRINTNLREDKGYTYGANSLFRTKNNHSIFMVRTAVRADATDKAIIELQREINEYASKGILNEELAFTQKAIGRAELRNYETPNQLLHYIDAITKYDLDDNFVTRQLDVLNALTKESIDEIAADFLQLDDMIIVVVGDKKKTLTSLKSLDMPIIELNGSGEFVKRH